MNIERVRIRVKRGGHDVPEDRIIERRGRSFEQLKWFFAAADKAYIFDNSDAEPRMIAYKVEGNPVIGFDKNTISEIFDAVLGNPD